MDISRILDDSKKRSKSWALHIQLRNVSSDGLGEHELKSNLGNHLLIGNCKKHVSNEISYDVLFKSDCTVHASGVERRVKALFPTLSEYVFVTQRGIKSEWLYLSLMFDQDDWMKEIAMCKMNCFDLKISMGLTLDEKKPHYLTRNKEQDMLTLAIHMWKKANGSRHAQPEEWRDFVRALAGTIWFDKHAQATENARSRRLNE